MVKGTVNPKDLKPMTKFQDINAVVLAAGKGTRMKSEKAKVLHQVFFKPMVHHVLDTICATGIDSCTVIIGHQRQRVAKSLQPYPDVTTVVQREQLGTGHAVLFAEESCLASDTIMILCGDTPLIRSETLEAMIEQHRKNGATLTLMTTRLEDPFGYGRIVSDQENTVSEIVEQKDCDEYQLELKEINAGIYLADRKFLFEALKQVGTDNAQGEVYLTDIVTIANRQGHVVYKFAHPDSIDVLGVNSRIELSQAHQELQRRRNQELMLAGVTIYGPETVMISPEASIEQDTVIYPGVRIIGNSTIGRDCILESGVQLEGCHIASQVTIGAHCCLNNCNVATAQKIPALTLDCCK